VQTLSWKSFKMKLRIVIDYFHWTRYGMHLVVHLCHFGNLHYINYYRNYSVSNYFMLYYFCFIFAWQVLGCVEVELHSESLDSNGLISLFFSVHLIYRAKSPSFLTSSYFCRYLLGWSILWMYRFPFHESIMYGAQISASDHVLVLAIFQVLIYLPY